MQIGANDVFVTCAFVIVFRIVTSALHDISKWCGIIAKEGLAAVIFVADNVTEFLVMGDDITDQTLVRAICFDVEDADSF